MSDKRRNNRPPEWGKIKPGEVRNPNGRRGKDLGSTLSSLDKLLLEQGARPVTRDAGGPVDATTRLVQEDFHDALVRGDKGARTRLLDRLAHATEKDARANAVALQWIFERKHLIEEEFYQARRAGFAPPDILPHPTHVRIDSTCVSILGPYERDQRVEWELLKAQIRVAAHIQLQAQRKHKACPAEQTARRLALATKERRRLMRKVPPGWNWREIIWCRNSCAAEAQEIIDLLNRLEANHA